MIGEHNIEEYLYDGLRYAVITWEDTILFDSDNLSDVIAIYNLWKDSGFVRGVYDYLEGVYIDVE